MVPLRSRSTTSHGVAALGQSVLMHESSRMLMSKVAAGVASAAIISTGRSSKRSTSGVLHGTSCHIGTPSITSQPYSVPPQSSGSTSLISLSTYLKSPGSHSSSSGAMQGPYSSVALDSIIPQ
jgi:hypothetical protein